MKDIRVVKIKVTRTKYHSLELMAKEADMDIETYLLSLHMENIKNYAVKEGYVREI